MAVLTLIASIAIAGCSDPDEQVTGSQASSGVGDAFAARALSVCESAIESKDDWSALPAPDFDPNHPDPSAFPEVGTWLEDEVGPTFDAWRDDLTALGTPPTGREAWTDVLNAVGAIAQLNADQVAAAKSDDADAFVEATNGLHDVQPQLERATAAAGVAGCAEVHAA
ncbi:MAG: hypothetical protein ABI572_07955 [Actinomycetota bacterium]